MKKILLLSLFFSSFMCAESYDTPKTFKYLFTGYDYKLNHKEEVLIDNNQFLRLIEPYLNEAQQKLMVFNYCNKNNNYNDLTWHYFDSLKHYNSIFFKNYIKSNSTRKKYVERCSQNLLERIKQVQKEAKLEKLNIQEEFQNTIDLFNRINIDYYNSLSKTTKFSLFLGYYSFHRILWEEWK